LISGEAKAIALAQIDLVSHQRVDGVLALFHQGGRFQAVAAGLLRLARQLEQ